MIRAARFVDPNGRTRLGSLVDGSIRDAGDGSRGFVPNRAGWELVEAAAGPSYTLADVRLLPPVAPTKIVCVGLNYRDHAEESGIEIPSVPVLFSKHPSCLIGHGETIRVPREETRPDFEGELAVVIARRTYRVRPDEALAAVGAYCAFNDVSGRRAQLETPLQQFVYGKSFDTFGPMGPCLAPIDGVDLGDLEIETVVSGETMQHSSTRYLVFSVAEIVAYASIATTLMPGDVIATGTPGGVGDARTPPRYLRAGDVVEISIDGIPPLRNPVADEDDGGRG